MTFPLESVVVLDLGDEPMVLASRLLADLGADVIRVESIAGDGVRQRGPFVHRAPGLERGLAHIRYNAGKRSVALDLTRPEAWEIVRAIARRADVAFAPLDPSPLAEAFFDEAQLRTAAPSLGVVEAVVRRNAPRRPATDLIGTAAGGMLYLNGYPEDPPNHPAGELAYKQTSLAAALGAMSLLLQQQAGGPGGRITVSMQEAMMWTTIQTANQGYWYWHQQRPQRHGVGGLAGRTIFPTRDGRWVSVYQHPPAWGSYVAWVREALGETTFDRPEWNDDFYRFQHSHEVIPVTERLCASMDRDDLVAEGQRRAILVVPVQGVMDIARDPHLRARDFFQTVHHQQLGLDLEVMRPPFRSSAYTAVARRAPALGDHSREVLTRLCGFDAAQVDTWIAQGLVSEHSGVAAR